MVDQLVASVRLRKGDQGAEMLLKCYAVEARELSCLAPPDFRQATPVNASLSEFGLDAD
jgi:hypothetical protein